MIHSFFHSVFVTPFVLSFSCVPVDCQLVTYFVVILSVVMKPLDQLVFVTLLWHAYGGREESSRRKGRRRRHSSRSFCFCDLALLTLRRPGSRLTGRTAWGARGKQILTDRAESCDSRRAWVAFTEKESKSIKQKGWADKKEGGSKTLSLVMHRRDSFSESYQAIILIFVFFFRILHQQHFTDHRRTAAGSGQHPASASLRGTRPQHQSYHREHRLQKRTKWCWRTGT